MFAKVTLNFHKKVIFTKKLHRRVIFKVLNTTLSEDFHSNNNFPEYCKEPVHVN